jgi:hypothetical protein
MGMEMVFWCAMEENVEVGGDVEVRELEGPC